MVANQLQFVGRSSLHRYLKCTFPAQGASNLPMCRPQLGASLSPVNCVHRAWHISHDGSMYAIYANIWGIFMVNVTIYIAYMDPMGYETKRKRIYSNRSFGFLHPGWIQRSQTDRSPRHGEGTRNLVQMEIISDMLWRLIKLTKRWTWA